MQVHPGRVIRILAQSATASCRCVLGHGDAVTVLCKCAPDWEALICDKCGIQHNPNSLIVTRSVAAECVKKKKKALKSDQSCRESQLRPSTTSLVAAKLGQRDIHLNVKTPDTMTEFGSECEVKHKTKQSDSLCSCARSFSCA